MSLSVPNPVRRRRAHSGLRRAVAGRDPRRVASYSRTPDLPVRCSHSQASGDHVSVTASRRKVRRMSGFRVGVMAPTLAARPAADTLTRATYLDAAASRVDSFWVSDHINGLFPRSLWQPKYCGAAKLIPTIDAWLEPWTMLGHLAARNRVGRLRLGVGVTDTGRRNPAVTAQAAATLHLLTRGRAILGIGPGEREGNEPYGVDWSKPVARFEEALATIRALWDSNGKLVKRDSPYFPLRDALFDLPPYRGKWPEIWIGAHGPRMLRAAGRYGDAWFPGFPQRPQDYAQRLEVVRAAASDAGRDPMSITPALQTHGRHRSQSRRRRRRTGLPCCQGVCAQCFRRNF